MAIKWGLLFFLLFFLISSASATTLTFETLYPECVNDSVTSDFMDGVRCGAYFLTPNFHFPALWNIGVNAFRDAVVNTGENVVNSTLNIVQPSRYYYYNENGTVNDVIDNQQGIFSMVIGDIKNIVVTVLGIPFVVVYGVVSSILVYLLLMLIECIKTYLIIAVSWCLWSTVFFGEIKYMEKLGDLNLMVVVIPLLLIGGSILLFVFDVSIWRVI